MGHDDRRQFGTPRAGTTYAERPGAYAVTLVAGRVLVVATPAGLYLPGGGLAEGETAEDALRREVREETGYRVAALERLGSAGQYVGAATNKIETFFAAAVTGELASGAEPDHLPRWVGVDEAIASLAEEAQAWAVQIAWDAAHR